MRKVYLALTVLAFVSCRFDQNGNKNILPQKDEYKVVTSAAVTETPISAGTTANSNASVQLDAAGNYIYDIGEEQDITLPDGTVINVGSLSTENKLFTMLTDESFTVREDKTQGWVTLDRVYFNTGSDEMTTASEKQIGNIVSILKAFPQTTVKFGGYTDNTGSQEINQPLSEGRAKAVMNIISGNGIDAERMTAEGYGSEHPVCPTNDTDVCKAQNRRVDIRITKK